MCDSFIVREDKSGIPFLLNTSVHNYLNDQPTYMTANITTEAHHARDFRDMGPAILTTATVMTSTALLMVLARLYVRLKMTRSWGLDDHCILVALVGATSRLHAFADRDRCSPLLDMGSLFPQYSPVLTTVPTLLHMSRLNGN